MAVASPSCRQSPTPLHCPSPSLPSHCRRAFNRRCRRPLHRRCPVHRRRRRAVHCCRCHRVAVVPSIVIAARLSLPSSPLRCRCTVHRRPSPLPLRRRRAVGSPSSPLPSMSLLLPPPPPAFADPHFGWLLRCCPLSDFVIACHHAPSTLSLPAAYADNCLPPPPCCHRSHRRCHRATTTATATTVVELTIVH